MENQKHFPSIQMIPEERIQSIESSLKEVLLALKNIKPGNDSPDMLTPKEVMKILKIGRWKFDQLIADNELEYVRKKRKIYISPKAITQYFEAE
jgi:helix-turn-helix protein